MCISQTSWHGTFLLQQNQPMTRRFQHQNHMLAIGEETNGASVRKNQLWSILYLDDASGYTLHDVYQDDVMGCYQFNRILQLYKKIQLSVLFTVQHHTSWSAYIGISMFYLQPLTRVICDMKTSDFYTVRETSWTHSSVMKSQCNTERLSCQGGWCYTFCCRQPV